VPPNRNRERGPIRGAGIGLRSLHHETVLRVAGVLLIVAAFAEPIRLALSQPDGS